jgi:hypothetical protein
MTSPEQAALAFVARLTARIVITEEQVDLRVAVAELIAAERAAVREACAAHVLTLRRPLEPDWWDRYIADALRALPID